MQIELNHESLPNFVIDASNLFCPAFSIDATNLFCPALIEVYADFLEKAGATEYTVTCIRRHAETVRRYQKEHPDKVKIPEFTCSNSNLSAE